MEETPLSSFDVIGVPLVHVIDDQVTSKDFPPTSQKDFVVMNLTNGPVCLDLVYRTDFPPTKE